AVWKKARWIRIVERDRGRKSIVCRRDERSLPAKPGGLSACALAQVTDAVSASKHQLRRDLVGQTDSRLEVGLVCIEGVAMIGIGIEQPALKPRRARRTVRGGAG